MLRSYSAVGRDRHSCVLECSDDYPALWVHFGLARFFMAIPTENEGTGERGERRDTENRVGGAAEEHFCVIILALRRFPRGVRWGEMWKPHCGRAPDCAKESSTLWTLFIGFAVKYVFVKPHNNCYPRTAASTPRNTRVYGKTRPALIYGRSGRAV